MHQEKKWELLRQEQIGKQINACVLLLINEVELFIYRFLTLGAKKPKNSLNRSSWGSTDSLAIGVFNTLASYRCLYRTLTGKEGTSTEKGRLLEKRVCFLYSSTSFWPDKGNRLSRLAWVGWPEPRSVQPFGLENLSFSIPLFSNT